VRFRGTLRRGSFVEPDVEGEAKAETGSHREENRPISLDSAIHSHPGVPPRPPWTSANTAGRYLAWGKLSRARPPFFWSEQAGVSLSASCGNQDCRSREELAFVTGGSSTRAGGPRPGGRTLRSRPGTSAAGDRRARYQRVKVPRQGTRAVSLHKVSGTSSQSLLRHPRNELSRPRRVGEE
jgi:hypothetical protein